MSTEPEAGLRGSMGGDQRLGFILATAEQMFFERGYRGVSVRDLASAVGIQISSLYYYFGSKDDILYRIIKGHLESLLEVANRSISSLDSNATYAHALHTLIRDSVIHLIDDRLAAGISSSQSRELPADQVVELNLLIKRYEGLYIDVIRQGITAGEFVETDVALAVYVILGAQVRLSAWFQPGGRLAPEQVAETYAFLLVRSLLRAPQDIVE